MFKKTPPSALAACLSALRIAFVPAALLIVVLTALFAVDAVAPTCCRSVALAATAGDVSVNAVVEKETVSMGEPFTLQIQVEGTDSPPGASAPDMTGVTDFVVESLGSQSNNRSSITIINGQMTRVESRGYVYSYRLTPKKTGQGVIPAITVPVASQKLRTGPITIRVIEPETTEDFHLEIQFSKTKFYVGEPVLVTVTWYVGREVEGFSFNLPLLEQNAFSFADPGKEQDPSKQYYNVPVGQGSVVAEKGRKAYRGGEEYTTVSFRKVLFAREAGTFQIPEGMVSCRAMVGLSKSERRRGPFDMFNDDFFTMGRRQVYKTFVAHSEPVSLTALPLPEAGKPSDFSGCVGQFSIETSASPTDVSVGDPITLTASISGSEYLENIELPSLARDAELEQAFKIPEEMSAGIVKDGKKIFTQTLRAKSEAVKTIPPIRFAYFDPERGAYQVALSKPIPIQVKAARVVTEADMEGRPDRTPVKSELEAWSKGIAHNYEGPDLLEDRSFRLSALIRSPLWLGAFMLPFCVYVVLLLFMRRREKQMADPDKVRSRKAFAVFKQNVKGLTSGDRSEGPQAGTQLLDALRNYLGDKLRTQGEALTFADAEKKLKDRGIDGDLTRKLGELFAVCEEGRYGGGLESSSAMEELTRNAMELVQALERRL